MIELLALTVGLATGACALFMVLAWRPWKRDGALAGGLWGGAAGCATAILAVYLTADRWPGVPPDETWQWIVYVVLAAGLVGGFDAARRWPVGVRLPIHIVPAGLAGALLVGPWVESPWLWRVILLVLVGAVHEVINNRARRVPGASVPLALLVAATGASIIIVESNNAKLFQLAVGLSACMGVCTVLAWWRPSVSLARGTAPVIAVALAGLLISAKLLTYAAIPTWSFIVASLAPLGLLIDSIPAVKRLGPVPAAAIRVAGVLIPTTVAVVAAIAARSPAGY